MSKEIDTKIECCEIWNSLKDKTKMIDFLINAKTEIDQLKQQLEESFTEEDVESLIEDRDKTIKFMQKELAEKDCRIEELEGQFAYECECNKQLVDLQKQLAIQELAEVERLLYESHYKEIDNRYYAEYEDIKNLIDSRIQALEELKG